MNGLSIFLGLEELTYNALSQIEVLKEHRPRPLE
jgi:hypothetical protein